jgi:ABC-type polysaccharide/polyol phosphate transport system ATPase subunit
LALNDAPELLLVDEALSVGDQEFRTRCADRLLQARRDGCTLILATHDRALAEQLCVRALWLRAPGEHVEGPAASTLDAYQAAAG